MNDSYTILKTLLRTEKGMQQLNDNKYFFSVQKSANKIQIKQAVETVYKVKVASVNTRIRPGKAKRVRQQIGQTPEWKSAIVTLKEGQKIEITA